MGIIIKRSCATVVSVLFLAVFLFFVVVSTGQAQCQDDHWRFSPERYISACGVTIHLGIEAGYATYSQTQLRAFDELEEIRCKWNLPADSDILCYRAYLAFPAFFGWFYPEFMRQRHPAGFPGDNVPLSRRLR